MFENGEGAGEEEDLEPDDWYLDQIARLEADKARLEARQLEYMAAFTRRCGAVGLPGREFMGDLVGARLHWSRVSAERRMNRAWLLQDRHREVLEEMHGGHIDRIKAETIAEAASTLDEEKAADVGRRVLPRARTQTLSQLKDSLRRAVLRADPDGGERRRSRARSCRRVEYRPGDDGTAELLASLPVEICQAGYARIDRLARGCRGADPTDTRSMDQLRADVLGEVLLGHHADRPSAEVNVTVPMETLLGPGQEPGELAGYGPITAEHARMLAADGVWRRMLTEPLDGTVLELGRTRYRPSKGIADHISRRDRHCRFPGCRVPAQRCDIDHTVRWADGGSTAHDNLGLLCRHHHRLKDEHDWQLAQPCPGHFRWTDPYGRSYLVRPEAHDPEPEAPS